jgi:cell division protein FtsN
METYEHHEPMGDDDYMTKDYANRRRFNLEQQRRLSISAVKGRIPVWAWIGSGLALAGILIFAYYQIILKDSTKTSNNVHHNAAIESKKAEPQGVDKIAKQEAPRFDFYTLLPNMTVEVPDIQEPIQEKRLSTSAAISNVAKASVDKPTVDKPNRHLAESAPAVENNHSFIIQAGSFKQHSQAEELKALLTLNGFEASVQTVKIDDGDLWYRVYLGPFQNKNLALSTQTKLEAAQSINSLILKMRV